MKNRVTLIIVAIVCLMWAFPGCDPFPIIIDDIGAGAVAAVSILKLIQKSPHMSK